MNMSSANSYIQSQAFSSGDQKFQLIPLTQVKTRDSIRISIDVSSFINLKKRDFSESPIKSSEDQTFAALFGLSFQSLVPVQGSIENPSGKKNKQIQPKENSRAENLLYAAVPNINKCLVCKQTFVNYFQHIGNQIHKKRERSFLEKGHKPKISLQDLISKLIVSIDQQNKCDDLNDRTNIEETESSKRQRVNQNVDQLSCFSVPRKRRAYENEASNCVGQILSTCLLNSNSFAQKESFFD